MQSVHPIGRIGEAEEIAAAVPADEAPGADEVTPEESEPASSE